MKQLDSFNSKNASRVYAMKEALENKYPHIDWRTEQSNPDSSGELNVSLFVPFPQYKEAELIYQDFKSDRGGYSIQGREKLEAIPQS